MEHVSKTYDATQNNRHMIGPEVSSGVIQKMYGIQRFYNRFYPSPTGKLILTLLCTLLFP